MVGRAELCPGDPHLSRWGICPSVNASLFGTFLEKVQGLHACCQQVLGELRERSNA